MPKVPTLFGDAVVTDSKGVNWSGFKTFPYDEDERKRKLQTYYIKGIDPTRVRIYQIKPKGAWFIDFDGRTVEEKPTKLEAQFWVEKSLRLRDEFGMHRAR